MSSDGTGTGTNAPPAMGATSMEDGGTATVETIGRAILALRVSVIAAALFALNVALWGYAHFDMNYFHNFAWLGLFLATVIYGIVAFLRWSSIDATQSTETGGADREVKQPGNGEGGTVICCSGGGIKSAAFCLGALQRLNKVNPDCDKTIYSSCTAVVGVSGGGYMAAAFAARSHLDRSIRVFDPTDDKPAVAQLRRRTNYLVATPRVRFDLACQMFLGILVNLMLAAGVLAVCAWLLVTINRLTDLVGPAQTSVAESADQTWTFKGFSWEQFIIPIVLVILSFVAFLHALYRNPDWRSMGEVLLTQWLKRKGVADFPVEHFRAQAASLPVILLQISFVAVLLYPGVPFFASQYHQFDIAPWFAQVGAQLKALLAVGVGVAAFVALVKSAIKSALPSKDSVGGRLLSVFRRKIAPILGVILAVVIWYACLVGAFDLFLYQSALDSVLLLGVGALFYLLAAAAFSANKTSLFPFYKERLNYAYLSAANAPRTPSKDESPTGSGSASAHTESPASEPASPGQSSLHRVESKGDAVDVGVQLDGEGDESKGEVVGGAVQFDGEADGTRRSGAKRRSGFHRAWSSTISWIATARKDDGSQKPLTLAEIKEGNSGGPELVLCATANVADGDLLPTGRNGAPFVLSSELIGFTDPTLPGGGAHVKAEDYYGSWKRGVLRRLDVASAVAISGAAVAPLAGRETKRIGAMRILLALANIRLGVWLRNPYWDWSDQARTTSTQTIARKVTGFLDECSPFRVISEAFGTPSVYKPLIYVTDGGHYDNLGLVEALRRRPTKIYLLDGSGDAEDEFSAMGDAIATARMDHGIEVCFNPAKITRGNREFPQQAWCRATATYPERDPEGRKLTCEIFYVKSILPRGLSWDLASYKIRNSDFPATSMKFETYDEFDFEAFRQLGFSVTEAAEHVNWGRPCCHHHTSAAGAVDAKIAYSTRLPGNPAW